jgi:hypothetical protein
MRRKFVYLVFDNPELNGGGSVEPPAPVEPPEGTEPPAEPPVEPSADPDEPVAGTPEAGLRAAAKAERVKRQAAQAEAQTAREEAAYYRGIAERPVTTPAAPVKPAAPAGPPEAPVAPLASQFEDYSDFEAADAQFKQADRRYIVDLARYEARQEFGTQVQQQQRQQTDAQITAGYIKRLNEEAALDPDIRTISDTFHLPGPNHIPLTDPMQEAIRESDVGPKLLRYFANNKPEVLRLASLSPVTQLREIGRIEAGIINKPQPVVRHVTTAPEPIKPLGGTGITDVDEDKMSPADHLAYERLKMMERRKRS